MATIHDVQNVEISKIIPYKNNAKTHSGKQLELIEKSIEEYGFISPCLIDENNNLIAGHGRIEAAQQLGIHKVPCVRVDGLTEEQRKAFIIADNKLTEMGGWDKELLSYELNQLDVAGFDIELTGFDESALNYELPEREYYGDERERTVKTYNLDGTKRLTFTDDFWEMPTIRKEDHIPEKMIGFNYAKTSKEKDSCIHFYLDDYQFERIWNNPDNYIELLLEYDSMLSPDFSLYLGMPMPMKIWNTYRSRYIGAYFQSRGAIVIPCISWGDEETYEFCFRGIEQGAVVSVSTIGVKENKFALGMWQNGMKEMIKQINPSAILVYGGKLDFDYGDIEVRYFENQVTKRWKNAET